MILFHYTCQRAAMNIRLTSVIVPAVQPELAGTPVIWLADIRHRTASLRTRLGLPWHTDRPACANERDPCDPVAARFGVVIDVGSHPHVRPFSAIAADFPDAAAAYRALPGAHPWRWWVATAPVRMRGPSPANLNGGIKHV